MANVDQKLENDPAIKLEKDMYTKYEAIRARVHKLQGIIDSLEGGQWEGIGRAAFDKKQFEINESLIRIGGILGEVMDAMTTTRNITASMEDEVRASVNKIDVQDGAPTVPSSAFNSM